MLDLGDYIKKINKFFIDCVDLGYKMVPFNKDFNFLLCPVNRIPLEPIELEKFNRIYQPIAEYAGTEYLNRTKLAPKGGVSTSKANYKNNSHSILYKESNSRVDLAIFNGLVVRFQFASSSEIKDGVLGKDAFNEFKKLCDYYSVDLDKYSTTKEECGAMKSRLDWPHYMIKQFSYTPTSPIAYTNMYHIDFHSSFLTGLCNTHKEFQKVGNYIYNKRFEKGTVKYRKTERDCKTYWKAVANSTIGYFHSVKKNKDFFPILAKDAISDNNDRINRTIRNLKAQGYIPSLINTDGIWYMKPDGKEPYHDEFEGEGLGKWSCDYKDCELRIKSEGAYDFRYINDNGEWQYETRIRGVLKCELMSNPNRHPREDWTWEENMMFTKEGEPSDASFNIKKGWILA